MGNYPRLIMMPDGTIMETDHDIWRLTSSQDGIATGWRGLHPDRIVLANKLGLTDAEKFDLLDTLIALDGLKVTR